MCQETAFGEDGLTTDDLVDRLEFMVLEYLENNPKYDYPKELEESTPPELQRNPSNRLRKEVFERDRYRCQACGGWKDLAVDHTHPFSKGGLTTLENLQTLCKSCNSRKGDRV